MILLQHFPELGHALPIYQSGNNLGLTLLDMTCSCNICCVQGVATSCISVENNNPENSPTQQPQGCVGDAIRCCDDGDARCRLFHACKLSQFTRIYEHQTLCGICTACLCSAAANQ